MHYDDLDKTWNQLTSPGGAFEIETVSVRGVSVKAYKNAPATLRDIWQSTRAFGDRDYLVYENERLTYKDAHARCDSIAQWLTARGVAPGDRIAIAMRNYPEWMLIFWACASIGAVVVGLNAWWSPKELKQALADSEPKVVFADQERLAVLIESHLTPDIETPDIETPAIETIVAVRTPPTAAAPNIVAWKDVIALPSARPEAAIDPDEVVCLFYTSGTSGTPKGAEITHRSAVCNIFNVLFAADVQARAARLANPGADAPSQAPITVLVTTPLFHVTANNCAAQIATVLGGKVVLLYRWDPAQALQLIEQECVTTISGVPVMTRELVSHPNFASTDTSSLMSMGGGGAPLPPDLVEHIAGTSPHLSASTGYGMTEASGVIASIAGDFFVDKPTSCGRVLPTFDAKCVTENGSTAPQGSVGELWVKGASIIKGYYKAPEATASTITSGWLHTGDLGYFDAQGFLHIVDRKKDMVLRGGENVFCAEIEAALYRHPDILECCVFAVPDDRLGETVGVAVVCAKERMLTRAGLLEHCAKDLAAYKIPEHVWFLSRPIPRNANGKFMKKELLQSLGPPSA